MASDGIIYGLDDKPPLGQAVVLALQHVLTMFGSTVAVPLLLGPAMGMSDAQIALLISSVMLCSGVATLLQSTFGSRLPIIQGVSFSFLAAFFAINCQNHYQHSGRRHGRRWDYGDAVHRRGDHCRGCVGNRDWILGTIWHVAKVLVAGDCGPGNHANWPGVVSGRCASRGIALANFNSHDDDDHIVFFDLRAP